MRIPLRGVWLWVWWMGCDLLFPSRATEQLLREQRYAGNQLPYAPRTVMLATVQTAHAVQVLQCYQKSVVRAAIVEAKFHQHPVAFSLLGNVFSRYLETLPFSAIVIPVPLSETRLRKRGYNQVERCIEVAMNKRAVSNRVVPPIHYRPDILVRTRDTLPQTTQSGMERRRNLLGAFAVMPYTTAEKYVGKSNPSHNYTYIVVDDVCTTGSTLAAAAAALEQVGIHSYILVALAYQPIGA